MYGSIHNATENQIQHHDSRHLASGKLREEHQTRITLRREMGMVGTMALYFNSVVGSGIFITPSTILKYSGSFGVVMILWVVGGLITFMSSLCYLELALLIKKSGSTYIYVKEAYSFTGRRPWMKSFGSLCGFLVCWTQMVIAEPLANSIGFISIGSYLCRPFFIGCKEMPMYAVKMFGLFILTLHTIILINGVKLVAKVLTYLSYIKVLVLIFPIILATWKLIENGSFPEDSRHPFEGSTTSISELSLGLYGVMYAYDGWTMVVMSQEEIKNTAKNIPRVNFICMPIIIVFFLLINASFFAVLSYDQILNTEAVGLVFGDTTLGRPGLVLFCVMVVVLMFGSEHSAFFGNSREFFVTAREGSMPQFISGIHVTHHTPVIAIIVQSILAGLLLIVGDLESFLNAFSALSWFWYGAAIFAIFVMRITLPDKHRPYKVLLFFPSVMVVVSILLVVLPLWQDPLPQLLAFAGVLLGIPVFCFFVMEEPWKLKPKAVDRVSEWLTSITSKLFNTEVSDQSIPP